MRITSISAAALAAGLGMSVALPAMAATTGYSLGNNGRTLVTMTDLSNPGMVSGTTISDDVILSALAYRPNTDQLYGFSQQNGTVYTVDTLTGTVNAVASVPEGDPGIGVAEVGFDFNNFLDAARIVSTAEDNLVFFPNNDPQNVSRFTDLAYNDGDVNEGSDPSIFANAYTNQVPNPAETLQYVLDSELDILATLDNNAGTINTIGQISIDGMTALDFTSTGGFEIFSPMEGENIGYTILSTVTGQGLYQIDDFSIGESGFIDAMFLGDVGADFGNLDSLAVFDVAPIPLPAGVFLMGGALMGFGVMRRMKRAA